MMGAGKEKYARPTDDVITARGMPENYFLSFLFWFYFMFLFSDGVTGGRQIIIWYDIWLYSMTEERLKIKKEGLFYFTFTSFAPLFTIYITPFVLFRFIDVLLCIIIAKSYGNNFIIFSYIILFNHLEDQGNPHSLTSRPIFTPNHT